RGRGRRNHGPGPPRDHDSRSAVPPIGTVVWIPEWWTCRRGVSQGRRHRWISGDTDDASGGNRQARGTAPHGAAGRAWNYSLSTAVLGRVIEVVSGTSFDAFLRERIINPLSMTDTAFVVSDSKWPRFSTVYSPNGAGGIRPMKDPEEAFGNAHLSQFASYKEPKKYFSGGAGLTSTIQDYARFAQMLLNGGTLDGRRVLSPPTI